MAGIKRKLPIRRHEIAAVIIGRETETVARPWSEPSTQLAAETITEACAIDGENNKSDREDNEEHEVDTQLSCVEEDDCMVVCDDIRDDLEEDGNEGGIGVEEEIVRNLEDHIGGIARDDLNDNNDDADIGDDQWNEDTIPDPFSSDDDNDDDVDERRLRNLNPSGNDQVLWLGQTFSAAADFKYALLMYTLKTEYDIKMYKSASTKLIAVCSEKKCMWRVHCSWERGKNKLMIKTYRNEHICVRSGYSKVLKISAIAQIFEERLRRNPKFSAKEMVEEVKLKHNLIVSEDQCKKVKTKLLAQRKASHESQFARIWDYQAEILSSNKESTMDIETVPGPTPKSLQRFSRLYICFKSLKKCWKQACRPIIGLDGTFLKWDIKGVLLAAVGRDGDNRIFPIAWAVVEVENNDNWNWFIKHIKKDLSVGDGENLTLISDKHWGTVNAVQLHFPEAEHRMCAKHILDRWKKNNTDIELERMFWKIARSYTTSDFYDNLEKLRKYNQGAFDSLQQTRPMTWSRAFFKIGSCCNDNLNNLSESFNRSIRNARKKPLLDMLEDIRRQCMQRNAKRLIVANRLKTRFTPRAHAQIELTRVNAKDCIRYMSTKNLHEIDYHGVAYRVDMIARTCGCGMWQLNGIPCILAICVITSLKHKVEDYVSEYYTTQKWREAYGRNIEPVEGMKLWPRLSRLPVLPLPMRSHSRGRESSHARRKSPHESKFDKGKLTRDGRVPVCSRCKQEGHNKRRCNNPIAVVEKRPRGRPRKYQGGTQASQDGPEHTQENSQGRASQGRGNGGVFTLI